MSINAKFNEATEFYCAGKYGLALPLFQDVVDFLAVLPDAELNDCVAGEMFAEANRMLGDCLFSVERYLDALKCYESSERLSDQPEYKGRRKPCASMNREICAAMVEGPE